MSLTNEDIQFFILQKDLELCGLLLKKEYSLNAVDNYGDNLLHVSAAHGCTKSVRIILKQTKNSQNYIDRKNKFGWTPLMQAVRNNNLSTVKILLENGADVSQRNYLGASPLTLAAGISDEMFEIIYRASPSMLENAVNDDITPLCVAAMRNDKDLFLRLLELGFDSKNESVCTHLVMWQSVYPEIQKFANQQKDIEDYWNDESDNIEILEKISRDKKEDRRDSSHPLNNKNTNNNVPAIFVDSPKHGEIRNLKAKPFRDSKLPNLDLLCLKEDHSMSSQSISPNLIYNLDSWFVDSSNLSPNNETNLTNESEQRSCSKNIKTQRNVFVFDNEKENHNSKTENQSTDHNTSLTFTPEFSPSRSPRLPSDFEDEDVCGSDTPTPPHYKTPPQGMVLNSDQAKLVIILKRFNLAHHIPTFLAEEVDFSLFLTLNDQDLTEIGIKNEKDKRSILTAIDSCVRDWKYPLSMRV